MTISLSGNPIVKHEARSQWRRGRAYWLLLVYSLLLTGLTVHFYGLHSSFPDEYEQALATNPYASGQTNPTQALAQTGREIFQALSTLQAALWLLIAPALTATSIAGEREAGLLEALQLTRLRASQIVGGKFTACLWLVLLLILAALPPLSICFLLGGVAPTEFVRAAIVQLLAAISGASIGLYFSSRALRPSWAMSQTFTCIILWSGGAYFSWLALSSGGTRNAAWDAVLELILATHPVSALQILFDSMPMRMGTPLISSSDAFIAIIGIHTILCAFLLRAATRATAKQLPAAMWVDRDRWTDRLRAKWQAERERREAARLTGANDRLADDAKMALLAEFPIERWTRFSNPVLRREVRHKFRWRKASLGVAMVRGVAFLVAACLYVMCLFLALDSSVGAGWWTIAMALLLVQTVALAFMAATSFSREREAGTWENLNLSSLRPTEVLWGKIAAPMVTLLYYSVPFWPIMLVPFARSIFGQWNAIAGSYTGGQAMEVVASLAVLASSAFATTAWALLMSWLCRKTVTAVSWTIVSLFAFHFGTPLLLPWMKTLWMVSREWMELQIYASDPSSVDYDVLSWESRSLMNVFSPWSAIEYLHQNITSRYYNYGYGNYGYGNYGYSSPPQLIAPNVLVWANVAVSFLFGAAIVMILLRAMRRSIRVRDHYRGQSGQRRRVQHTAQVVAVSD